MGKVFFSPVLVSPKDFMSEIAFPLFHSGPHNITLLTLGPKCEMVAGRRRHSLKTILMLERWLCS